MDYWRSIPFLCSILLLVFAIYRSRHQKDSSLIYLIVFSGLILRITISCDPFLHDWDERFHALVAKNLMNHPFVPTLYDSPLLRYDPSSWVGSHIWLHKQPLPLWLMSTSLTVFGVNEFAVRIPSIILGALSIWLTYQIAIKLYGYKVAVIASALHALHGLSVELIGGRVATDHIDIIFAFFIELAVYFTIVNRRNLFNCILIGLAIGLAVLTKWLPAFIALGLYGIYHIKHLKQLSYWKDLVIIAITACVVFIPWQFYIYSYFPLEAEIESSFNYRHFTEALEGQGGPWYYFIHKFGMLFGEFLYIPLVILIWRFYQQPNIKSAILLAWIIIPIAFFSFPLTKMQGYILFISPAAFILIGLAIRATEILPLSQRVFKGIFILLLLGLPLRYSFERFKPFEKVITPGWMEDISQLKKVLNQEDDIVVFNFDRPIEAMFYTNNLVYNRTPTEEDVETLKKIKRRYIIWNELR